MISIYNICVMARCKTLVIGGLGEEVLVLEQALLFL